MINWNWIKIPILVLAALLRFYGLGQQSLWADEGNSVALTRLGIWEIAQRTAFDIHPPFYYWLLRGWVSIFGTSEIALRSLSALLGVGVVYLIWRLGLLLFNVKVASIAAFVAALSPLLVYYSQETRMYMLLTLLSCLTVLTAVQLLMAGRFNPGLSTVYVIAVTTGLYTHYAYPIILIVVNAVAVVYLIDKSGMTERSRRLRLWFGLQMIPLLLYLPWLPTAWRQLTVWPGTNFPPSLPEILQIIADSLLLGLSWPYEQTGPVLIILLVILVVPALYYLSGISETVRLRAWILLLYLWFLLPVVFTIYVFSPAFLKFLVVAIPALALLLAITGVELVTVSHQRWLGYILVGLLLLEVSVTSLLSLYNYYTNSAFARDNYRDIAQFLEAVGSAGDAIILNAEGQQDVFGYYYHATTPVYPLPRQRPLDKVETEAELEQIANQAENVYAVYWAEQQADPAGLIEGWLNTHLYKATDHWYGNVRLVGYASQQTNSPVEDVEVLFGPDIQLTGVGISPERLAPGDILRVTLIWKTAQPLAEDYTVFLQLLDASNHLVGQRDAAPQTRSKGWVPNTVITDTHGIFVEPGTPPGQYRLIVGLYHSQTGKRLPVTPPAGLDFAEIGKIEIVPAPEPLPVEAFDIHTQLKATLFDLQLLGYDFYKAGYRSKPHTPLHSGDLARLVLYWMATADELSVGNTLRIDVVAGDGTATDVASTFPLAGVDYSPDQWQNGEIVRGQYDLFLTGLMPGDYRLRISVENLETDQVAEVETQSFEVQ
jgi:4-amino-4-deoxy-L-arabinose transferase-like glycosyltransferase